ncbi:cupredoxin domain-containing protein [Phycicoccus flavus]|uniref:cupredoxin domain-containing protein n=1 Tax=Phycicoccus flavus TaxID=2502783 RepID=UPI000FEBDA80|nr:cupredoxin domain-containing protein [Phycicoccus flavus]NHA68583.1 peptidase [Phycicoccus flavus]
MRIPALLPALAVCALALTGCGESDEGTVTDGAAGADTAGTSVTVTATDDACELSATSAKPGSVAFTVTNEGSSVTEFYLYASDEEIIGEVENIGPGLTRTLTIDDVVAGDYVTACKPGQSGDGIRADFEIS